MERRGPRPGGAADVLQPGEVTARPAQLEGGAKRGGARGSRVVQSEGGREIDPWGTQRSQHVGRRVDPHLQPVALPLARANRPEPVDVPLDDMAAERLARPQRRLDVQRDVRPQAAERRAPQRPTHSVERQPAVLDRRHGEAHAVERDRVADRGRARPSPAPRPGGAPSQASSDGGNVAKFANDPRKDLLKPWNVGRTDLPLSHPADGRGSGIEAIQRGAAARGQSARSPSSSQRQGHRRARGRHRKTLQALPWRLPSRGPESARRSSAGDSRRHRGAAHAGGIGHRHGSDRALIAAARAGAHEQPSTGRRLEVSLGQGRRPESAATVTRKGLDEPAARPRRAPRRSRPPPVRRAGAERPSDPRRPAARGRSHRRRRHRRRRGQRGGRDAPGPRPGCRGGSLNARRSSAAGGRPNGPPARSAWEAPPTTRATARPSPAPPQAVASRERPVWRQGPRSSAECLRRRADEDERRPERVDWIVSDRPDVDVVNLSLGSNDPSTPALCEAADAAMMAEASIFRALRTRGVTVVGVGQRRLVDVAVHAWPSARRDRGRRGVRRRPRPRRGLQLQRPGNGRRQGRLLLECERCTGPARPGRRDHHGEGGRRHLGRSSARRSRRPTSRAQRRCSCRHVRTCSRRRSSRCSSRRNAGHGHTHRRRLPAGRRGGGAGRAARAPLRCRGRSI